jgi:hypothetical protein
VEILIGDFKGSSFPFINAFRFLVGDFENVGLRTRFSACEQILSRK